MNISAFQDQLLLGDSLALLPTLPDESVDVIFADPPYNLQLGGELWRPNLTKVNAVNDAWDKFASFDDYDAFTRVWLAECQRIMKARSSIWVSGTYHNIFRVGTILQDLGFWILNTVTWFKPNAMPNFNGTRLKNDVEFVIWAKKSERAAYTFNHHVAKQFNDFAPYKQLGSVWRINACGGGERLKDAHGVKLHSTQKPAELLKRILLISSHAGDMVLDPFSGTGTTAAVAKQLRRHWCGIERDPTYHAAALERLARVTPLPPDAPLLVTPHKSARVSVQRLIMLGILRTGQNLYLDHPACEALLLENGDVRCGDIVGSIHKVGRMLKHTPACNGWKHWSIIDADGQRVLIDTLRQKVTADVP